MISTESRTEQCGRPRRILYLQYTNPAGYPPLEHSSRMFADSGWEVAFAGTAAVGTARLEFPKHPGIVVRRLGYCRAGWKQKLHYGWFCLWSLAWAVRWRPGWVYASDLLACPPAWLVSVLVRAEALYHEHDSPSSTAIGPFARIAHWARKKLAHRARLCILPNALRARHFAETTGCSNVAVIWNCPSLREVFPAKNGNVSGVFRLYYHGNLSRQLIPETVVHALAMLPADVRLDLVGYETAGNIGYVSRLLELAASVGIRQRIEFHGALPRFELLSLCREADVGIALVPDDGRDINSRGMSGASNKVFDYLACGVPLLVADEPQWREMLVEPGYAAACDPGDPQSIAAAIRRLYDEPAKAHAMGEGGRRRILAEWNYEGQFQPAQLVIQARERERDKPIVR